MKNRTLSLASIAALFCFEHSTTDPTRHMRVSSPLFNEISGKLGGAVGMTSRFGMFLRGKITPHNPDTAPQFIVRNVLSSLAALWRTTLTSIQRASWDDLAEDTSGAASGLTLFIRGNSERVRGGLAVVNTAPASVVTEITQIPTNAAGTQQGGEIYIDSGDFKFDFKLPADAALVDPWAVLDGGAMNISLSRPQRATRSSRIKPFVLLKTILGDTTTIDRPGGTTSIPLNAAAGATDQAVIDAFESFSDGDVCYARFTAMSADGRRSRDFEARLTVITI